MTPLGFFAAAIGIALVVTSLARPIGYYAALFLNWLKDNLKGADTTFNETKD